MTLYDLEDHGKTCGLPWKLSRKPVDYFNKEVIVRSHKVRFIIFK